MAFSSETDADRGAATGFGNGCGRDVDAVDGAVLAAGDRRRVAEYRQVWAHGRTSGRDACRTDSICASPNTRRILTKSASQAVRCCGSTAANAASSSERQSVGDAWVAVEFDAVVRDDDRSVGGRQDDRRPRSGPPEPRPRRAPEPRLGGRGCGFGSRRARGACSVVVMVSPASNFPAQAKSPLARLTPRSPNMSSQNILQLLNFNRKPHDVLDRTDKDHQRVSSAPRAKG
jgi:hypothetical protein